MGADHVRRIGRTVGGARVVAVADPDGDRAKEAVAGLDGVSAHSDAAAAIAAPGVDAVLVASPGAAHEEALLHALARELPVLCEKPLTPDPAGPCGCWRRSAGSAAGWSRWASCGASTPSTSG